MTASVSPDAVPLPVRAATFVWRLAAGPLLLVAVYVVGALAGAALAAFLTWAVAS